MIHQFRSKNCAPVIMLGDLTERIFAAMNRPFESKGILLPEQLPEYISRLDNAIEKERMVNPKNSDQSDDANALRKDPLGRRAFPFMELLKQAQQNNESVVWGID